MHELKLKKVNEIDLSQWNFQVSFNNGDNFISKIVEEFLGAVEFEFSFPSKRAKPLNMRVFVALEECGYESNPYIDVDTRSEIEYLIDSYISDKEEGDTSMSKELLAMAEELASLSKKIMVTLNETI